jgi:hypothetical protein
MSFDRNVFINCPFDKEYDPILQAILFTVLRLGMIPRLASESLDSAETRLTKICSLISASKYSIHDLSRCVATKKGEHFRLNMPFELGIDYGYRQFGPIESKKKRFLILEEQKYRYQAALSDISGCDIGIHGAAHDEAIRVVRNWLVAEAGAEDIGPSKIIGEHIGYQEWYWEKKRAAGHSERDIREYPTAEVLEGMREWNREGRPMSFN